MSTAITTDPPPPAYPTVLYSFWGEQLPHVVVGPDDVRVVLQDAVKAFSGIASKSNRSSKLKEIMAPYQNGAHYSNVELGC